MARPGPRKAQMGVALDADLRAHLDVAAEDAGHSVAEEIRRRLEATIRDDMRDPTMRGLFEDIDFIAHLVAVDSGQEWHASPVAFAIFRAAVGALLDHHEPKAPAGAAPETQEIFGGDDPGTVGRALVRHLKRERAKEGQQQQQKGEPDGK